MLAFYKRFCCVHSVRNLELSNTESLAETGIPKQA
jgi:hypothetical protein